MPVAEKDDFTRKVKCKYSPIASNYKGYRLPVSVENQTGRASAMMRPFVWEEVPVVIAKQLQFMEKQAMRRKMVTDGDTLEEQMRSGTREEREEFTEPDYAIQVDGKL